MADSDLMDRPVVAAAVAMVLPTWTPSPRGVADCPRCDDGRRPKGRKLCDGCRAEGLGAAKQRWWKANGADWRRNRVAA